MNTATKLLSSVLDEFDRCEVADLVSVFDGGLSECDEVDASMVVISEGAGFVKRVLP